MENKICVFLFYLYTPSHAFRDESLRTTESALLTVSRLLYMLQHIVEM